MTKRWIISEEPEDDKIERLSEELNINKVISKILVQRGITTYKEAEEYFNPSLDNLHDPFLLKDIKKAIERLNKAILKNEKILIYGDYDVDGTTSVALVYGFLRHFHANVNYYIPDRYKEGYGVSKEGIEFYQ